MSLMILVFISVECKRPATVRRRRMVKRLGGQISVGWVSIVLDYSPLLLINSREREINICIATCKICRESGEGECGGGKKGLWRNRSWNDHNVQHDQGHTILPPTSLQKPISHKQTNRNLVLPSADMCRTMGVHTAFCYTCFESNLVYSVKVKGAHSLTRLHPRYAPCIIQGSYYLCGHQPKRQF